MPLRSTHALTSQPKRYLDPFCGRRTMAVICAAPSAVQATPRLRCTVCSAATAAVVATAATRGGGVWLGRQGGRPPAAKGHECLEQISVHQERHIMSVMSDTSFIYSLYSLVSQVPPTSWKPRPREMVPKEKPSDCRKGDTTGHTWQRGAGLSNPHTAKHCRAALLAPHHDSPVDMEPQGVGVLEAASHDDAAGDEHTPPNSTQPGVRLQTQQRELILSWHTVWLQQRAARAAASAPAAAAC